MQLEAAALLLYRAASRAEDGLPSAEDTAVAKAYCNRVGFEAASEALEKIHELQTRLRLTR